MESYAIEVETKKDEMLSKNWDAQATPGQPPTLKNEKFWKARKKR